MTEKIVIALGGNALGKNVEEQKEAVKITSKHLVDLVLNGNKIIVGHGNGPQVGMINLAMDEASKMTDAIPNMPFPECGAMSQGYIGYHLQNALLNEFYKNGRNAPVATLISQVLVDKDDEAFKNPTKPIGSFYSKEEAEELSKNTSYKFKEDAGRGYRRVVASPKPIDIVEKESIENLYDSRNVVIACGGGGIPVIKENGSYRGVDAVIDKDFSLSLLADLMDADVLLILTAVEKVAINFGKEDETWLDKLDMSLCEKYIKEGQFAEGSMLPKIKACMEFVKNGKNRRAIITSLDKALDAMKGETGTVIVN